MCRVLGDAQVCVFVLSTTTERGGELWRSVGVRDGTAAEAPKWLQEVKSQSLSDVLGVTC